MPAKPPGGGRAEWGVEWTTLVADKPPGWAVIEVVQTRRSGSWPPPAPSGALSGSLWTLTPLEDVLGAKDKAVLDRLMQLATPVKRDVAQAQAESMGYGRRKFDRVWAVFPDDRKRTAGAPKGAKRKFRSVSVAGNGARR